MPDIEFPAQAGLNRSINKNLITTTRVPRASWFEPVDPGNLEELESEFPAQAGLNRYRHGTAES